MSEPFLRIPTAFLLAGALYFLHGETVDLRAEENTDPQQDGSQYAYAENAGWFNAEPLGEGGPGIEVTDSSLRGYLWAENLGWISLACANTGSCGTVPYGITNDENGNLSGFAWGENVGWINFSPAGGGVFIDPTTGNFSGRAWGENIGWLTFGSTGPVPYGVRTAWPAGSLQFAASAYGVPENAGQAFITVTRKGGSRGSAGAGFSTGDGTAVSPGDYGSTSTMVFFPDGDLSPRTVAVPIVQDDLPEGDETILLSLSLAAPSGGAFLGAPDAAVLTILDLPGRVQFEAGEYTVAENGGAATIVVTRAGGAGGTVGVGFSTLDGSALAPGDYAPTFGTVSFPPGDIGARTFDVPVVFDLLPEPDETAALSLQNPTGGASLGSPATAVLTILDTHLPVNENADPGEDGSQYAYGENVGWINVEPSAAGADGLKVGDLALAGYLWSENAGWINLSCANAGTCGAVPYGVSNDGFGFLSGFAWGENVGWINFAPAGGGVLVDPATGTVSGRAWGGNIGWITFSSSGTFPFLVRAGCQDADGDGIAAANFLCPAGVDPDCDDTDPLLWGRPGEAQALVFLADNETTVWVAPGSPGGNALRYDTIRSLDPADFVGAGMCVEWDDGPNTQAMDGFFAPPGTAAYYLVRAENSCPLVGQGSVGETSAGVPRTARNCP